VTGVELIRIGEGVARVPMWLGVLPSAEATLHTPTGLIETFEIEAELVLCEFRGVGIDQLKTVLAAGIDVTPTDSPIYASDFKKAWEYGGIPKVVLALDGQTMERTWRQVPADTPEEVLAPLRDVYPTVLEIDSGEFLWLTRMEASDRRAGTPYEAAYGWWIPGDPWETLQAIFVFAPVDLVTSALDR
jgi:hypothetical protein